MLNQPKPIAASLLGLAAATNSDPLDNGDIAIKARAAERRRLKYAQEDEATAARPDAIQQHANDQFNRRNDGDWNDLEWTPFFEKLNEAAERNGSTRWGIGGMPGLPTDTQQGTVPLSLQGLQNATYDYDKFGFPVALHTKRS